MGLLDDAIREHLELKRRRGADPSEIAREETEALGPVRREAPAEAAAPPSHEPAALDEPAVAYDDEPDDLDAPGAVAFDDEAPLEPEPALEPERPDPLAHQPTREFSATELDEALGQPSRARPRDDDGDDEVGSVAAGDHAAAAAAEDDAADDELEETPDFLQETPEHDRLWFEQKPPKDFDF